MIWYKFWRESRIRFYIGMASIAALCLIHIFAEPKFSTQALDRLGVHNYVQYIYRMVYHGQVHALAQLLCMVLGLGGLQRDRKQGTLGFTLALPFGRTRCVAVQVAVGLVQITAIALVPVVTLWAVSPLVHQQFSPAHSLPFVPLWIIGGFVLYAVSVLSSATFKNEYVSLAAAWVAYLLYTAFTIYPSIRVYPVSVNELIHGRLGNMIDLKTILWTGTVPVTLLCGFVAAALLLLATANFIISRQDL